MAQEKTITFVKEAFKEGLRKWKNDPDFRSSGVQAIPVGLLSHLREAVVDAIDAARYVEGN